MIYPPKEFSDQDVILITSTIELVKGISLLEAYTVACQSLCGLENTSDSISFDNMYKKFKYYIATEGNKLFGELVREKPPVGLSLLTHTNKLLKEALGAKYGTELVNELKLCKRIEPRSD